MTDSARTEEIRALETTDDFTRPVLTAEATLEIVRQFKEKLAAKDTELSALREEVERLKGALAEILSRFPEQEIIDALMADMGYGYRPYAMEPTPRDSDIVRWRAALSPSPAQQETK